MAVGIKRLCGVALPATTLTAIYTATQEVALSTVVVCNRGTTATTFRLAHAPGGAADNLGDYFAYDAPIAPKQMVPFTIGICLAATDVLRAYAGNANLTVIAWGEEGAAGGAGTFLDLVDTPDSYTGQASKVVRVNAGATATEFGPVLGSMAQQDADAVMITGGAAYNLTELSVLGPVSGNIFQVGNRSGNDVIAFYTTLAAAGGTNRWAFRSESTAPNYFAGNVGIGISPPSYPLDVTGTTRISGQLAVQADPVPGSTQQFIVLHNRGASHHALTVQAQGNDSSGFGLQLLNTSAAVVGSITYTASATAFNTSSDVRLKHAVQALGNALSTIQALNPVSFRWNADDSPGVGFLAHELMHVVPEAVTGEPDAVSDDGSVKPQQVDHSKLIPWIIAALQDVITRVTALEGVAP